MIEVRERETIGTILELSDTAVVTDTGFAGVAVHLVDGVGNFDGTIVYFPGYTYDQVFIKSLPVGGEHEG